jgi:hypothetical protein
VDPNQQRIVRVKECSNMYPFELLTLVSPRSCQNYTILSDKELLCHLEKDLVTMFMKPTVDLMHWHQCLGHLNTQAIA